MATTKVKAKPAAAAKGPAKIDMKQQFKELYRPSAKKVSLLEVPEMIFLMIDGSKYPEEGSPEFQEAIGALYGMAYTLKFMLKGEGVQTDFTVMPLEGLWWMQGNSGFDPDNKEGWRWTLMIAMPPHITEDEFKRAKAELKKKKDPPALGKVRLRKFSEGKAVQIMHIGSWSEEGPTIEKLHAYARENGLKIKGKHHEIYMSDPRRTAPEKLKTVVRQPVR